MPVVVQLNYWRKFLKTLQRCPLDNSEFFNEVNRLAYTARKIRHRQEMEQFVVRYKQFFDKFGHCVENGVKQQQGLLRLLNKLMDNTQDLLR